MEATGTADHSKQEKAGTGSARRGKKDISSLNIPSSSFLPCWPWCLSPFSCPQGWNTGMALGIPMRASCAYQEDGENSPGSQLGEAQHGTGRSRRRTGKGEGTPRMGSARALPEGDPKGEGFRKLQIHFPHLETPWHVQ